MAELSTLGSVIKTAYEGQANTNAFTDAEQTKLAGIDAIASLKSNLAAAVAPTANEDSGDGYAVGSRWVDTTANKEYVCLDATVGAAVWTETTGGGGGGPVEGTDVLSTGEVGGTKFLREDGDGTCSWQAVTAGAIEGTAVLSTGELDGIKVLHEDGDGTCSWRQVEGLDILSTGEVGSTKFLNTVGDGTCIWSVALTPLDVPLDNFAAAVNPTANDDSNAGYTIGSRWINISTDREFVCLEAAVGIAIWKEVTNETIEGTAILSTGEAGGTKFLREDGDGTCSWQAVPAAGLQNVVEDLTPQLGGSLDVNGQKIVSVTNGNIDIEPHGTGNVLLGNMTFDADQTIGVGQDNYVLTYDNAGGLIALEALPASGLANVVEDTTPQLGGSLDVNGQKIVSVTNGNIDIEPHGTGNVLLGNYTFDADQAVGAGQDNYVLKYDNAGGLISLEAMSGGFTSFIDDQANGNYAIGLAALDSLTAGSGIDNIAIGTNAGTAITTGDYNVAIGTDALKLCTTLSNQIAIGAFALDAVTTGGTDNLAIGVNALSGCTFGDNNIAIGTDTLKVITTGGNCIAIGKGALDANVDGNSNIAIGVNAGGAINTSDERNIFIGNSSGSTTTTCSDAVFIGNSTATSTTTGSGSVVIGTYAGTNIGSNNVALGYGAAYDATTPTRCILIGTEVEPITASSATDELVIGYGNATESVRPIAGKMGAISDVARSSDVLTITGPSAFPTAVTNIDAGDLILQGGTAATTGNGVGGDVIVKGGTKGSTGTTGKVLVNNTIYGIMSVQGGVTSQDNIGSTPIISTAWNTDGISNGMTVSSANDYITASIAGVYEVNVSCSFSGTASSTVTLEIYVYDSSGVSWSASGFAMQRKLGTAGDVGSTSINGLVTLDTNDRVAVYIATDGATDDITMTEAQLVVKRISD